jgi:hypothetical protein
MLSDKNLVTKGQILYEITQIVKLLQEERRTMTASYWGKEVVGSYCLMGMKFV